MKRRLLNFSREISALHLSRLYLSCCSPSFVASICRVALRWVDAKRHWCCGRIRWCGL